MRRQALLRALITLVYPCCSISGRTGIPFRERAAGNPNASLLPKPKTPLPDIRLVT